MPRKFTDKELDTAEEMRARGCRWIVIEACLGEYIQNAVWYRRHSGFANRAECERLKAENAVLREQIIAMRGAAE